MASNLKVLRTSKLKDRQGDLEDLSAVYKRHKALFFEDEKDKKENILQLSSDLIEKSTDNSLMTNSEKANLYHSYEPEIQPRNTIETREYLKEVGIKDEMKKIDLYKNSHVEDPKRSFEKLNIENPINKVLLKRKNLSHILRI